MISIVAGLLFFTLGINPISSPVQDGIRYYESVHFLGHRIIFSNRMVSTADSQFQNQLKFNNYCIVKYSEGNIAYLELYEPGFRIIESYEFEYDMDSYIVNHYDKNKNLDFYYKVSQASFGNASYMEYYNYDASDNAYLRSFVKVVTNDVFKRPMKEELKDGLTEETYQTEHFYYSNGGHNPSKKEVYDSYNQLNSVYYYNQYLKLLRSQFMDNFGKLWYEYRYFYDSEGHLQYKETYDAQGIFIEKELMK